MIADVFYTLLKFLGWGILLALVGGCVGWALRALKARRELARARISVVDQDEVDRLRRRLVEHEQVVAERDRLRMQIADMRHTDSPGVVGATAGDEASATDPDLDSDAGDSDDADGGDADSDAGEVEDAADHTADAEPAIAPDLTAAARVIGKPVEMDDLTAVEGIGPKIAELCRGIGITTWRQLGDAEVSELRSMLDAAGSRYRVHDPQGWPAQAALLADGRWDDFTSFTDTTAKPGRS